MTQADLAAAAGVKQQMISKLETGKAGYTGDIVAIANALGVSAEYLQTGMDQPHEPTEPVSPSTGDDQSTQAGAPLPLEAQRFLSRFAQAAADNALTPGAVDLLERMLDQMTVKRPDDDVGRKKDAG